MASNITKFNLRIVTPYKDFFCGDVSSCVIPTTDGDIGFMAGHSPLVVALKPGVASYTIDDECSHFSVSEGFADVSVEGVTIVCNSAEYPEDISIRRICNGYDKACRELEETQMIEDKLIRKLTAEPVRQAVRRASARRHLIELYGSAQQKERLQLRREEINWH